MQKIALLLIIPLLVTSCFEDRDDNPISSTDINDFVYKGLNSWYFWQESVPDLADNRFSSDLEYNNYLNSFNSPNELFDSLLFEDDRFSWIVDDYIALNNSINGVFLSNGLEFGLVRIGNGPEIMGYIRYVLPNSVASTKNIQRGDFFLEVDGQQLTENNFRNLLSNTNYTLGMASVVNNNIVLNNETITLTKIPYTENPVYITETVTVDNIKIGYLMYNRFTGNFDEQLNNAFANFLAEGIDELVIDLRYNPGGSVTSAINLSSMITGQFTGNLFLKQRWNSKALSIFEDSSLKRNFVSNLNNGSAISHLNLSKVYILAQGSSASASELVINGLNPYIDVIHIGDTTTGKNEFSITIFDVPECNYLRTSDCSGQPNPSHLWAMQPLVGKNENAVGFLDYEDGLNPDISFPEDLTNLGILGQIDEPLFARAIQHITGNGKATNVTQKAYNLITDSNDFKPTKNNMYLAY